VALDWRDVRHRSDKIIARHEDVIAAHWNASSAQTTAATPAAHQFARNSTTATDAEPDCGFGFAPRTLVLRAKS
jgi:hypothetical protein